MRDDPDDRPGAPAGSVGTQPLDHAITREDFERALRRVGLSVETVRDDVMQLAAQVVALTDALTRRLDAAPADSPAPPAPPSPSAEPLDAEVDRHTPASLEQVRRNDEGSMARLLLGAAEDKYAATPRGPDCLALLPVCQARCCGFHFALSTQDLDEGVIRWDYGKPYLVRQRPDDNRCVHSHPTEHRCTVYEHRPRPCRRYDCRDDPRIWADFERRILAGGDAAMTGRAAPTPGEPVSLADRVQARQLALAMETFSLNTDEAARGRLEAQARRELLPPRGDR